MSALGQKQTFGPRKAMSAFPLKADIVHQGSDVCFVPKADIMQCSKRQPIRSPRRQAIAWRSEMSDQVLSQFGD